MRGRQWDLLFNFADPHILIQRRSLQLPSHRRHSTASAATSFGKITTTPSYLPDSTRQTARSSGRLPTGIWCSTARPRTASTIIAVSGCKRPYSRPRPMSPTIPSIHVTSVTNRTCQSLTPCINNRVRQCELMTWQLLQLLATPLRHQ